MWATSVAAEENDLAWFGCAHHKSKLRRCRQGRGFRCRIASVIGHPLGRNATRRSGPPKQLHDCSDPNYAYGVVLALGAGSFILSRSKG